MIKFILLKFEKSLVIQVLENDNADVERIETNEPTRYCDRKYFLAARKDRITSIGDIGIIIGNKKTSMYTNSVLTLIETFIILQ